MKMLHAGSQITTFTWMMTVQSCYLALHNGAGTASCKDGLLGFHLETLKILRLQHLHPLKIQHESWYNWLRQEDSWWMKLNADRVTADWFLGFLYFRFFPLPVTPESTEWNRLVLAYIPVGQALKRRVFGWVRALLIQSFANEISSKPALYPTLNFRSS